MHTDGNACSWRATLVTLVDGRQVPIDSEEWRAECEARAILAMPTVAVRREHLALIEKRRGRQPRERLEALILDIWNRRRASAA